MSYCTAGEIEQALEIEGSQYGAWLTTMTIAASEWIDAYCHLPAGGFAVGGDTTRYYDVTALRNGALLLDVPCLAVTALTNADGAVIAAGNYRLRPLNDPRKWSIALLNGHAWALVNDGLYAVTGRFGWSATAPAPVQEAAVMLTGWLFKRYQAALQDNAAAPELGQIVYGEAIPKQVAALLAPFRNGLGVL